MCTLHRPGPPIPVVRSARRAHDRQATVRDPFCVTVCAGTPRLMIPMGHGGGGSRGNDGRLHKESTVTSLINQAGDRDPRAGLRESDAIVHSKGSRHRPPRSRCGHDAPPHLGHGSRKPGQALPAQARKQHDSDTASYYLKQADVHRALSPGHNAPLAHTRRTPPPPHTPP